MDIQFSGGFDENTSDQLYSNDAPQLIHAAFLDRTAATPNAIAVCDRGLNYSYAELESRSRGLGVHLQRKGLQAGHRVAIVAEHSVALVWSMLASLRAGLTFMVLDASYPEERLKTLARLAAPDHLIGAGGRGARRAAELSAQLGIPVTDAMRAPRADEALVADIDAAAPAYILFTSGSTGTPKAVAANHGPLSHFLAWHRETFALSAQDRFSMMSGLSHDPLLRDVFAPLSVGGTLAIPDQAELLAPGGARRWLAQARCTVVHTTPAMGQLITAGAEPGELADLRLIFWGGDLLPPKLLHAIAAVAPGVESVNFYGTTETPQAAAYFRCRRDEDYGLRTPIGAGIDGFALKVVDELGAETGEGAEGEVVVSSRYLSLGYVDGAQVTPWPSSAAGHDEKTYRTGDMGYRRADGAIVLIGRRDDQIKVRGFRVDLAEITAALRAHPEVEAAAVLPFRQGETTRIAAFVSGPTAEAEQALRAWLAERLPSHMRPDVLSVLPALPLLPNGKLDRVALQTLARREPALPAGEPLSPAEAKLIAHWAPLFARETLSPRDSFASLNGDSLSYVQAYLAAKEAIGEPPEDWATMPIADLAARSALAGRAQDRAGQGRAFLETPILLRALAIISVVCVHASLLPDDAGVTSALFLVSGYLLTKLQLGHAHATGRAQPILRYLLAVAAPTLLFGVAVYGFRLLQGHHPSLSLLTFTEDFYEWRNFSGPPWDYHEPELWYLHALLQMAAFVGAAVLIGRRLWGLSLLKLLSGLFVLGCVLRFVVPPLWLGDDLAAAAHSFSLLNVLPTTHLATLCLGGMFACAPARSPRIWLAGLAYAGLSAVLFGPALGAVLVISMLIIDARRVRAWNLVLPLVYAIANASLFIYLANLKVLRVAFLLPGGPSAILQVALTLAVGLGASKLWQASKSWLVEMGRATAARVHGNSQSTAALPPLGDARP